MIIVRRLKWESVNDFSHMFVILLFFAYQGSEMRTSLIFPR